MPDWDEVYSEKSVDSARPADVLKNNMHLLPDTGLALDYACGLGGNGVFLAEEGFEVNAWDLSSVAVEKINKYSKEKNRNIKAQQIDLENNPPHIHDRFDVIVVSYFLHRETMRTLYDMLKDGGVLLYQTFSGNQLDGAGPSREEFRLKRGELLEKFHDMELLFYREDQSFNDRLNYRKDSIPDQVFFVAKKIT